MSDRFDGKLRLTEPAPKVVLSYGLGVDSTAILLRYLHDPSSRRVRLQGGDRSPLPIGAAEMQHTIPFDLTDLVVVTAQTGDEWEQTGQVVEEHILPLLREHGIRFIECARRTSSQADGVLILQDTRAPERLHLDGGYRLSEEMIASGTVPQSGGARLCSAKSKGQCLDEVIAAITRGQPFRHIIGFEYGEHGRALRDAQHNTATRFGEYPLIDMWGWDRASCEDYIAQVTGVQPWPKSACWMCPFALTSKAGRLRTLPRYAADQEAGVAALFMEHLSVALNRRQGLIAGERLRDLVAAEGLTDLLDAFERHLDDAPHALYEVRRVLRPTAADPTKLANAARSLQVRATGSRAEMAAALEAAGARLGARIEDDHPHRRAWLLERGDSLPATEHFLVAAPQGAIDKENPRFNEWWVELGGIALAA